MKRFQFRCELKRSQSMGAYSMPSSSALWLKTEPRARLEVAECGPLAVQLEDQNLACGLPGSFAAHRF